MNFVSRSMCYRVTMSKINNILNRVNKEGSIPLKEAIATNQCAHCMDEVSDESFRDDQFRKKYEISGRCQSCQDTAYKPVGYETRNIDVDDYDFDDVDAPPLFYLDNTPPWI